MIHCGMINLCKKKYLTQIRKAINKTGLIPSHDLSLNIKASSTQATS